MTDRASEARGAPAAGTTFEALVMLFGTAALVHLGAAPDPTGGQTRVDLDQAKQAIDLLDMLQVKTKGNLTLVETEVLERVLFDLRCRYVDAVKER